MFRLFSKGKEKAEWAALVFTKVPSHPEGISEEQLRAATGIMIAQHKRIILESTEIVKTSRNQSTRTERLELCKAHYQELMKLERFADRDQKRIIADCKAAVKDLYRGIEPCAGDTTFPKRTALKNCGRSSMR